MKRNLISEKNPSLIFLGLLLALAVMSVALRSRAAQADVRAPFKGTLTVQFVISQVCAPGDANCNACTGQNGFYVEATGIGTTSLGPLFVNLLKCFDPNGFQGLGSYAGTLTTAAPNGKDSLTWAYSGQNTSLADFYLFGPFDGTLTITGGTGKFQGAHGSASFTATSGPSLTAGPNPVQYAGTAFYYVQGKITQGNNE